MSQTLEHIEVLKDRRERAVNPKKFMMWLFIGSIAMLFAALTSAYIVKQGEGNWLKYDLPEVFWITSAVIVLSSVFMQLAYISAKRDNITSIKVYLSITTLMGIAFLGGQYVSWIELVNQDVFFVGNPSGSFLYVLTGMHAVHLISGIIFLAIVLVAAFRYKIHSRNLTRIEILTTYWHFLGGLWLYLFLFLKLNH